MPTPDLIRPPEVLLQSMNHLLDNVLDRDMDEETPFINICISFTLCFVKLR